VDGAPTAQLAFDLAIDGYSSEWLLDAPTLFVTAKRWSADLTLQSQLTPTVAP
jgi:hypothetical protein